MSATLVVPRTQFCGKPHIPDRRKPLPDGDSSLAKTKPVVLIVDDEHVIADTLAEILNDMGFESTAVYDGRSALEHIQKSCPDILISDVVMPGMNGVELAKSVRAVSPMTRVVLLSGQATTAAFMEQAKREGYSFELLAKPIPPEVLLTKLRKK